MVDYSQFGQALILQQLITPDTPRFLVDIGAHNGIANSNSRALIEQGWRAILVEPLPGAFAELRENCRSFPNVTLFQTACSDSDGTATFRLGIDGDTGQMGSLSDRPAIARQLGSSSVQVETITLPTLFDVARVPNDFGVLLVDTEGYDAHVLKGLERTNARPRVIVTEDFVDTDREKYALLSRLDYRFVDARGPDSIWIADSHAVDVTSVRYPVFRLLPSWQPSGGSCPGTAHFEAVSRQCVIGWAFHQQDCKPPATVTIDLRKMNRPQRYVFKAHRVPRLDVSEHFQSPALLMSGFRACIDVPSGDYELRLFQEEGSTYSEVILGAISVQ